MKNYTFLNMEQAAEMLGCSVSNIRYLIKKEFNPLPFCKPKGSIIVVNGDIYKVPAHCQSKTKNKLVFIKEQVNDWLVKN